MSNEISKEVVIKITGSSKSIEAFKQHIKQITKDYTLPLGYFDDDFFMELEGEDLIKDFINLYNYDYIIPTYRNIKKRGSERREVLNFVFSMEDKTMPSDLLMKAVVKTIDDKYPNNFSCFVYQGDTEHPHIYCSLKIQDIDSNRINFGFEDGYQLRRDFAKNLNDLGIEAYATRKCERNDKEN
jgi:hypothetical protein